MGEGNEHKDCGCNNHTGNGWLSGLWTVSRRNKREQGAGAGSIGAHQAHRRRNSRAGQASQAHRWDDCLQWRHYDCQGGGLFARPDRQARHGASRPRAPRRTRPEVARYLQAHTARTGSV